MVSPIKGGVVVSFETGEGDIEHFPARHDHNIKTRSNFVAPVDLARPAFREVAFHGRPQLLRRSHAKSRCRATVGQYEEGHEPAMNPDAARIDALELWPAPDTLGRRE